LELSGRKAVNRLEEKQKFENHDIERFS